MTAQKCRRHSTIWKPKATAFETLRPALTPDISTEAFLAAVRQFEALSTLVYRISGFASLQFAADTQDQAAQTFLAQVMQLMAGIENRSLFFSLWWKDLDDENAARLLDASGDYRYWLEAERLFKPHTLTEPKRRSSTSKTPPAMRALVNLYATITNRYVFKLTVDGETKELTRGELGSYVRQHNPELRAAAYQELYRVYSTGCPHPGADLPVHGARLAQRADRPAPLASPIAARNLTNDIPDPVVDTLLEVCQRNAGDLPALLPPQSPPAGHAAPAPLRYLCPMAQSDKTYPFGAAADMVFDSFQRFDPRLKTLAQRVLRPESPGQRSSQGQAQRRVLRHHRARPDSLGAGQLPGTAQ